MPQVSLPIFVSEIRSGKFLGSFPTDTVPALAAQPDRADLIFQAKQRSLDKPLILMAGTSEAVWDYVAGTESERQIWKQVMDCYWPGALTLVLPSSDRVPASLNPKTPGTIGVRVPNHAIAQAILCQTGPLATTSANRSGQPALQTLAEIEAEFPEVLTLHPSELGSANSNQSQIPQVTGTPSTVARWSGSSWEILRKGSVILE